MAATEFGVGDHWCSVWSRRVLVWLGTEPWKVTDRPWWMPSLPPLYSLILPPHLSLQNVQQLLLYKTSILLTASDALKADWVWVVHLHLILFFFVSLTPYPVYHFLFLSFLPSLFLLPIYLVVHSRRLKFIQLKKEWREGAALTAYPEVSVEMSWMVISEQRDKGLEENKTVTGSPSKCIHENYTSLLSQ